MHADVVGEATSLTVVIHIARHYRKRTLRHTVAG